MLPFGLNIRSLLTHTTWYRLAIMSEVEFFTYFVIQRLELNELTYDKTENSRNENKKKDLKHGSFILIHLSLQVAQCLAKHIFAEFRPSNHKIRTELHF